LTPWALSPCRQLQSSCRATGAASANAPAPQASAHLISTADRTAFPELLRSQSLNAEDKCQELATQLRAAMDDRNFEKLHRAMTDLDFDTAWTVLEELSVV
jgi:hypothetical protein